MNKSFSSYFYN